MNRMGLNGLEALNKVAAANTFEGPGITAGIAQGLTANSEPRSRYYYY